MGSNKVSLTVDTVGGDGVAEGSAATFREIFGTLEKVELEYTGQPATTDVILRTNTGVTAMLTSRANLSTDATLYPRLTVFNTTAAASLGSAARAMAEKIYIHNGVLLSVEDGDAQVGAVRATLYLTT